MCAASQRAWSIGQIIYHIQDDDPFVLFTPAVDALNDATLCIVVPLDSVIPNPEDALALPEIHLMQILHQFGIARATVISQWFVEYHVSSPEQHSVARTRCNDVPWPTPQSTTSWRPFHPSSCSHSDAAALVTCGQDSDWIMRFGISMVPS